MIFLKCIIYFNVYSAILIKKILEQIKRINRIILILAVNKLLLTQFKRDRKIDKLNIGCGDDLVNGWLNISLFRIREYPYGIIVKNANGISVLNLDIGELDSIPPATIKCIYASHFIEHITHDETRKFLEKAYKWMVKGGVIRLTSPDLELWVKKYYENELDFFKKYHSIYLKSNMIRTKGEIFMSQCHGFGHMWNYDFESLKNIMNDAGFSKITKRSQFDSLIPEIGKLEPMSEGRILETFYIEAQKE